MHAVHAVIALRAYQEEAVGQILDYAAEHKRGRLLVVMAPRSGKMLTVATAGMLLMASASPEAAALGEDATPGDLVRAALRGGSVRRCLLVAHRVEILDAAREHLVACGVPADAIGVVYRDRPTHPDRPFQVASEATIDRRSKPEAHLVVWDEAHHDGAPRRRRIRALYPEAFHLGSTGTPHLLSGAGLDKDYDRMIVPVQPSELIGDGFLAVPTVFAPEDRYLPKVSGIRMRGGDYSPDVLERLCAHDAAVEKLVGEWERLAEGRRTVVFPVTVEHSRRIVAAFLRRGHRAAHLDGAVSEVERAETVAGLRLGDLRVVASVGVLSEGTDLPEVKCCVLARPTRSLALHIQQGARCMTPYRGERPRILDVAGNVYRHGFPYEDRVWSLERSRRGAGGLAGSTGDARAKRCACGAVAAPGAKVCAACGAAFAPPEPTPAEVKALAEVRWTAEQVAKTRAQLDAFVAKRADEGRPVAEGWVARVLAAMVGGDDAAEKDEAA